MLENVNFEMRPGESVAIVGASGSGKSTVLRLLLGLETPTRGGVYYDGKDLEELDLRLVRRQIGTVLEASSLFPGSLYENIAGSAPLTREQVMEAVRLAGLEADVEAMPMGLDSSITESGSQISGGQRQRVMIARALVNRPRLLFFDEATSALDNRTQAIVAESVAKMNATRIVVAHRLSTVRDVDRIIVLEDGRVVETGTYDELIAKGGAFQRLAQRQHSLEMEPAGDRLAGALEAGADCLAALSMPEPMASIGLVTPPATLSRSSSDSGLPAATDLVRTKSLASSTVKS